MKRSLDEPVSDEQAKAILPTIIQNLSNMIRPEISRISAFLELLADPLITRALLSTDDLDVMNLRGLPIEAQGQLFMIKKRLEETLATLETNAKLFFYIKNSSMGHGNGNANILWGMVYNGDLLVKDLIRIYGKILVQIIREWEYASRIKQEIKKPIDYIGAYHLLVAFAKKYFPETNKQEHSLLKQEIQWAIYGHKEFYARVLARDASFLEMMIASPEMPTEVLQIINNMSYPDIKNKLCGMCKKQATGVDSKSGKMFCGTKCQQAFYDMED